MLFFPYLTSSYCIEIICFDTVFLQVKLKLVEHSPFIVIIKKYTAESIQHHFIPSFRQARELDSVKITDDFDVCKNLDVPCIHLL